MSRETLTDELEQQLLQDIIDRRHSAGAALPPEADLAAAADVSRLTVREAVKALCAKNIVRIERGRGTFVNPPGEWADLSALMRMTTAQTLQSSGTVARRLIEARRVIEVGAAELAATRRTEADLDMLEVALSAMRDSAATANVAAFVTADIAFHAAVLNASGNVFLVALLGPLAEQLVEGRRQTSAYADIRGHAIERHEAILAAIRSGSGERAAEAMREHLDQTESDLEVYVLPSGKEKASGKRRGSG